MMKSFQPECLVPLTLLSCIAGANAAEPKATEVSNQQKVAELSLQAHAIGTIVVFAPDEALAACNVTKEAVDAAINWPNGRYIDLMQPVPRLREYSLTIPEKGNPEVIPAFGSSKGTTLEDQHQISDILSTQEPKPSISAPERAGEGYWIPASLCLPDVKSEKGFMASNTDLIYVTCGQTPVVLYNPCPHLGGSSGLYDSYDPLVVDMTPYKDPNWRNNGTIPPMASIMAEFGIALPKYLEEQIDELK